MTNFIEGSGFYPPTFNNFTQTLSGQQNMGGTETFNLTLTERSQINAISMYYAQVSSTASTGTYTIEIKLGNSTLTQFTIGSASSGNGVYLDTLIQNTSITLEKGDNLSISVTAVSLAGGQGNHKYSIILFGSYVL